MGAVTARIRVHLERIVVDGAPDVSADRLTAALVNELRRLAAAGAAPEPVPAELVVDLVGDPVGGGRALAAVLHSTLIAQAVDG